jgi:hypothetical protein
MARLTSQTRGGMSWTLTHEPPPEAPRVRIARTAAKQHADDLQQGRQAGILPHRQAPLPERLGENLEGVKSLRYSHSVVEFQHMAHL